MPFNFWLDIQVKDIPDTYDETDLISRVETWLQARNREYELTYRRISTDPEPTPTKVKWEPTP